MKKEIKFYRGGTGNVSWSINVEMSDDDPNVLLSEIKQADELLVKWFGLPSREDRYKCTATAFCDHLVGKSPMKKVELQAHIMGHFEIGKSKYYEVFREAQVTGRLKNSQKLWFVEA